MVKLTGGEALEAKLKPYMEGKNVVIGLDPAYLPVRAGEGLPLSLYGPWSSRTGQLSHSNNDRDRY